MRNGKMRYWVRKSTPAFGFFFYYTLDMAICPYLVSIFGGMKIWHPTIESLRQRWTNFWQQESKYKYIAAPFK